MNSLYTTLKSLAIVVAGLLFSWSASAQCTSAGTQYPSSIMTPTNSWQTASTLIYGGDYGLYNVTAGTVYQWSLCPDDGGSCSYDSQLTLFNNADLATSLAFSDDECDLNAKITWLATFTGFARVIVNEYDCVTNTTNTTLVYKKATAPANDDCAGAVTLTVGNGECNPYAGTVAAATASPNTGCGTGTPDDDVWFKFVVTSDTTLIDVLGGPGFDAVIEAFYGTTCSDIVSLGCVDGSLDGELESVVVTGLIPGETIWLRVYDWYSGAPTGYDFTICVFNPCAVTIPVGATPEVETCGTDLNGGCNMTTPAYQDIACNETVSGTLWADTALRDLDWYRFTVTANTTVTFTAAAELPYGIGILDISDCGAPVLLTNGGLLLDGAPCSTVNVSMALTPGTYAAVITVFDFNYYVCSAGLYNEYWATLNMTSPPAPTITPGGPTSFCQGGSVSLTSNSSSGNTWTPGGATSTSISATTGGSYTVAVPDPNGCGPLTSSPVTVTVNQNPTAGFTFVQNDPTVDFTSTTTGGTPGYNCTWNFGDSNTGSGATTSHTYATPNTYSVQLCVTDASGCANCTTQSVTILPTGIDEAGVENLNIFPNPAHDVLNIDFTIGLRNNVEVKLMGSNGQLVFSQVLNQFSGNYTKQLNTSSLATGNYMLQIVSESGITNRKIVVR